MSIRVLMAAAAVAVGVVQAEAATVVDYDIELRYEGTTFRDVDIGFINWDMPDHKYDQMPLEGNPYGIVGRYSHLNIGDIVRFVAQVVYPDDPTNYDEWPGAHDNGGRAPICNLGGLDCDVTFAIPGEVFQLDLFDVIFMQGTTTIGGAFTRTWWGPMVPSQHTSTVAFYAWWEEAKFTVLSVDQPAPVPLPMSVALMPVGLGALAMMRRRRRLS